MTDSEHGELEHTGLLGTLFHPRGVAIVGASGRAGSMMARPLEYLTEFGFDGELYPVNPRYEELNGTKCYPSLAEIGKPVDLVLCMVPAADSIQVVADAGAVGAKAVIVFASGFAEVGPAGLALQQQLVETARQAGVRVLGPNCQGLLHSPTNLFATFTAAAARPINGDSKVAYVGQSGAVGGSVLDLANEMGLSLTAWTATGNQADLDLVEIAAALIDDPAVDVVLMYAEGIADGERFTDLARATQEARKHLVILRSGRSAVGKKAAASHTGAMLGDDISLVLTAQQHGAILVDDVDELLITGALLAQGKPLLGNRIGIVTTSGGAGILLADHLVANGLQVPELSAETQQTAGRFVPDFGAVANPVDVTAQILNTPTAVPDFTEVCRAVADDPSVDGVAIVLTMVTGERAANVAQVLTDVAAAVDKPVWVIWLAGMDQTVDGRAVYREHGMPVFTSAGFLARVVSHIAQAEANQRTTVAAPANPDLAGLLLDVAATGEPDRLFDRLGISQPRGGIATTADEAQQIADDLGTPLAMKIKSAAVLHKTELGGVRLNVPPSAAAQVFAELQDAVRAQKVELDGIEIQQMIPAGTELIVGATCSGDGYPATITVGFGGVSTEIYRDVVSASAPVTEEYAAGMLRKLTGWPLLDGFRGQPGRDVDAVTRIVADVSAMAAALADRKVEFEINPLIVGEPGEGATAVDLLLTIGGEEPFLDE